MLAVGELPREVGRAALAFGNLLHGSEVDCGGQASDLDRNDVATRDRRECRRGIERNVHSPSSGAIHVNDLAHRVAWTLLPYGVRRIGRSVSIHRIASASSLAPLVPRHPIIVNVCEVTEVLLIPRHTYSFLTPFTMGQKENITRARIRTNLLTHPLIGASEAR